MKERFWEREGIYGGISWTLQDIQQIWYPAHGIHRQKGVVLGGVHLRSERRREIRAARARGAHQARRSSRARRFIRTTASYVESGVTIAWHQMNHMLGCAAQWDEALFKQWFKTLADARSAITT